MPFDVQEFLAKLSGADGVLRPAHFSVDVGVPALLASGSGGGLPATLPFFCEASALPGAMLSAVDGRRYGVGPAEKYPFSVGFTEMHLSFIGDGKGVIWNFFHAWNGLVCNHDSRSGMQAGTGLGSGGSAAPYELNYAGDYFSSVVIHAYNPAGAERITVVLQQAYPIFVGDVKLAWAAQNEFMRIPVAIAYTDWYSLANAGTQGATGASDIITSNQNVAQLLSRNPAAQNPAAIQTRIT